MINYTKFDLPADGLTQIKQVEHYNNNLTSDGWTMVGVFETAADGEEKSTL